MARNLPMYIFWQSNHIINVMNPFGSKFSFHSSFNNMMPFHAISCLTIVISEFIVRGESFIYKLSSRCETS